MSLSTSVSEFSKTNSDTEEKQIVYNKAKAEKIWKRWKDTEEYKLKQLNISKELIKELRVLSFSQIHISLFLINDIIALSNCHKLSANIHKLY